MKKIISILPVLAILPLIGCEHSAAQTLGVTRKSPDEFMVMSKPPLSVPPDFALRAPSDGQQGPAAGQKQDIGSSILGTHAPQTITEERNDLSQGETTLLQKAGVKPEDSMVRDQLNADEMVPIKAAEEEKNKGFFDSLDGVFSSSKPKPDDAAEPVVDSTKEKQRIQQNLEAGKPPTEGDPAIKTPKDAGVIDKIF